MSEEITADYVGHAHRLCDCFALIKTDEEQCALLQTHKNSK